MTNGDGDFTYRIGILHGLNELNELIKLIAQKDLTEITELGKRMARKFCENHKRIHKIRREKILRKEATQWVSIERRDFIWFAN